MPLTRWSDAPLLTRSDVPECPPALVDPSAVFNPGAAREGDDHVLMVRVQSRGRETFLWIARGHPDVGFEFEAEPVAIEGLEAVGRLIVEAGGVGGAASVVHHVYDPRLSRIDGIWSVVVAMDLDDRSILGVLRGNDLSHLVLESIVSPDDSRNGVLFPEMVGGRYLLLERPNRPAPVPGDAPSGDEIVLVESGDCLHWNRIGPVMRGRPRSWDERVGAGPPPIRTPEGWLLFYHGVATHFASASVYQVGAVLLDLEDPRSVLARTRRNLLEPRLPWELVGQVPNVVFPGGVVVEGETTNGVAGPEAVLWMYYGAADTVVGVATATVREVLAECETVDPGGSTGSGTTSSPGGAP